MAEPTEPSVRQPWPIAAHVGSGLIGLPITFGLLVKCAADEPFFEIDAVDFAWFVVGAGLLAAFWMAWIVWAFVVAKRCDREGHAALLFLYTCVVGLTGLGIACLIVVAYLRDAQAGYPV